MIAERIAMLAGDYESTRIVYNFLAREFVVDPVVIEEPVPRVEFLKRRMKKLGTLTVAGQILFQAIAVPALRRWSGSRLEELKREHALNDAAIDPAKVVRVSSANSDQAIEALHQSGTRVVVVNGTRIIAKKVLSSVPATFINMHAGITPLFRGVHGGYWAVAEGRPDLCGVTVHLVDEGIDTGGILGQAMIRPLRDDNFVTYPSLQLAAGLPLLLSAAREALAGKPKTITPPSGVSRLWSHPTLPGYIWRRLWSRVR